MKQNLVPGLKLAADKSLTKVEIRFYILLLEKDRDTAELVIATQTSKSHVQNVIARLNKKGLIETYPGKDARYHMFKAIF